MSAGTMPRPDRWLITPPALYERLREGARGDDALLRLRLETGMVQPVATHALADGIRELLSQDWDTVRIVCDTGNDAVKRGLAQALATLAQQDGSSALARVRLHAWPVDADDPPDSLDAPDAAVLSQWIATGRPSPPDLAGAGLSDDWIRRYQQAFETWRQAVEARCGDDFFEAMAAPAATPIDEAIPARVEAPAGTLARFAIWQALAANDDPIAQAGRPVARRSIRPPIDTSASEPVRRLAARTALPAATPARWQIRIGGHDVTVRLDPPGGRNRAMTAEVHVEAAALQRIHLLGLRAVCSGDPPFVEIASALNWRAAPGAPEAVAICIFRNRRGQLNRALHLGASRAALRLELHATPVVRLRRQAPDPEAGDCRVRYAAAVAQGEIALTAREADGRLHLLLCARGASAQASSAIVRVARPGSVAEIQLEWMDGSAVEASLAAQAAALGAPLPDFVDLVLLP